MAVSSTAVQTYFGQRAHPVVLRKFLGRPAEFAPAIPSSVRDDHEGEDEAAEDIRETNEYLQITEVGAVRWITDHSSVGGAERREETFW